MKIYIVKDEITSECADLATTNLNEAKDHARNLVKNFRNKLLSFDGYSPGLKAEMRAEKIKSSGRRTYFSWWGRKAEVEEYELTTKKKTK